MESKSITFDQVFKLWMDAEVSLAKGSGYLKTAKDKGFNSVVEWRLATALRLGLDTKEWTLESIDDPGTVLPSVIIGPYQGWSKFFDNQLTTSFAQALEIPEFLEWCHTHDRIAPLSRDFPLPTSVILFRKQNGQLVHVEGGHRMCAVAYAQKIGNPIRFEGQPKVTAAIAAITDAEISKLQEFLKQGTFKQTKTP